MSDLIEKLKQADACENCVFWKQPVSPDHCYSEVFTDMGDCRHRDTPIAKATFSGDWCKWHRPDLREAIAYRLCELNGENPEGEQHWFDQEDGPVSVKFINMRRTQADEILALLQALSAKENTQ